VLQQRPIPKSYGHCLPAGASSAATRADTKLLTRAASSRRCEGGGIC
jgi:hypothetical protein